MTRRFRNSGVLRITCVSGRSPNAAVREDDDETVAEYRRYLLMNDYAVVLFDGSMMQISYDFQGGNLIEHRLVYVPCPFQIPRGYIEEFPLPELIDHYIERGVGCAAKITIKIATSKCEEAPDHH